MKNKSYIGISLVVLIFGIWAVPKIVARFKGNDVVQSDRLNSVETPGKASDLIMIGKAPGFELTDQNREKVSDQSLAGKVYVVEFFFTSCPTICPVMNSNLKTIQDKYFGNRDFAIASITIDPDKDTPEVLKAHADELGITSANWHFLTGDQAYIYEIANKGFKLYASQNPKIAGGFEHAGFFALVDKKGNIRSRIDQFGNPIVYYDALEKEGIRALMEDIKLLLQE
jgi:protein SCO1/2